ncbi:hypothetical protein ACFVH4_15375 [Nocardia ignorata]
MLKGLNSMYRIPTAHDPRALRSFLMTICSIC